MQEQLKERLESIIKSLMVSFEDNESETISEYLQYMDSIRFIELITTIENEFGIEISNNDLVMENIKSIDVLTDVVKKYLKIKKC